MKKLFAIAAFLLASTAAQAQYTFEYGGRTIRVDPDRGTVSIPGVYDNSGRRAKRSRNDQDSDRPRKNAPQQAKVDPQIPAAAAPVQTDQAPRPQPAWLILLQPRRTLHQPIRRPRRRRHRTRPPWPNPHPRSSLLPSRRQRRNSRPPPPQRLQLSR